MFSLVKNKSHDVYRILVQFRNKFLRNKLPYGQTYIDKDLEIKDNGCFGDGVIVLQREGIGEGAVIKADSVVVSNFTDLAITGGQIIKTFTERDRMHYFNLIAEGYFH